MQRPFSDWWARAVTRHWRGILVLWIAICAIAPVVSPSWDEVAYDGDFEYLPPELSSVAGGRLLDQAFPGVRSRSQIVLILGRESDPLVKSDDTVGYDLMRRLYHRLGEVCWQRAIKLGYEGGTPEPNTPVASWIKLAREAFDRSINADEYFYERIADQVPMDAPTLSEPRMAIAYWDRGKLLEACGDAEDAVGSDFEAALVLMPDLPSNVVDIKDRDLDGWDSLLDVFSWDDKLIGSRMNHPSARLAVMRLSSELAATGNVATIEAVQGMIDDVLSYSGRYTTPGLQLLMTGSAAIGGETLLAARDAIRYTEWITVAMILLILAYVYRAPMLVAVPMVSIGIAVVVASSLVALLTDWSIRETIPGLDLRVFTTSRIFVVVILFGAGTDYCLFLISRLREEAAKAPWPLACRRALKGVSGALIGSAMTTVVGLGMLWIADYGKFHYTGPVIAICLLVGLLVCTTLTPALLRFIGPRVFWPQKMVSTRAAAKDSHGVMSSSPRESSAGLWGWIALMLTRHPLGTLIVGFALLLLPGVYGLLNENAVTYDFSSQLSHSAASRRGLRLMTNHFNIGEINPITVLMVRPENVPREEMEDNIKDLARDLYKIPGVATVRTADDPLGDFPPDRGMSLLRGDSWRRRTLRNHRAAERYFFSTRPELEYRLARLDVTMKTDPFSVEAADLSSRIDKLLATEVQSPDSSWKGSEVLLAGTTPSIIDLREVTLRDNQRIKIAVVIAVFAVLVVVIRRVGLCLYLIVTVLLSYYATLGITLLFFNQAYGDDFVGLDWKLPLFLFVILVAVGQDYNVYLVTRIVEEQRRMGWLAALRRAVTRTGAIITACGVVMAATFFSMTSSAWLPQVAEFFGFDAGGSGASLRGIVELGFALGLGVLIDTFYVRTILVPSFVALLGNPAARKVKPRPATQASIANANVVLERIED